MTLERVATTAIWEYLVIPEAERHRLPQLGMDGWELVGVGGDPDERPAQSLSARVTTDQRNRYYVSRGLDPERSPEPDST